MLKSTTEKGNEQEERMNKIDTFTKKQRDRKKSREKKLEK